MKQILLVVAFFGLVYGMSLVPVATGYGDSDELLVTSFVNGVAHPPGYALLVSSTHFFMRLFSILPPALVGNGLALIWQIVGLVGFYLALKIIVPENKLALIATMLLGLSRLYWLYATVFEVTGLGNALLSWLLWSSLAWYRKSRKNQIFNFHFWLTWVLAGLAVGHYQPMVLVFPGLMVLLVYKLWALKIDLREIIWRGMLGLGVAMGVFFLTNGLLWLQRSGLAVVSWHFPATFSGWWNHLARSDYNQFRDNFTAAGQTGLMNKVRDYLILLESHLGWYVMVLGVGGWWWLWRKNRLLLTFLGVAFLLSGLWFGSFVMLPRDYFQYYYFTGVAERQLFMGEMVWMLVAGIGLYYFYLAFKKRNRQSWLMAAMVGLVVMAGWNGRSMLLDKSSRQATHEYAKAVLNEVATDALVICSTDIDCYSLLYATEVEKLRTDVVVMPYVSTYRFNYLAIHPEIYPYGERMNPEFLVKLLTFNLNRQRRVYLTQTIGNMEPYFGWEAGPYFLLPQGQVFELVAEKPELAAVVPVGFNPGTAEDLFAIGIREWLASLDTYRGYLAIRYGNDETAKTYLNRALAIHPQDGQAMDLLTNMAVYAPELRLNLK